MRLRRFTDYGLRILIHLGERPERRCSIPEIAAAHGISESHLVKVAHKLGRLGFVETRRGRGGGVRLAIAPEMLSVGAVVRQLEGAGPLVDCGACTLSRGCGLARALRSATEAFYAELDSVALRDIMHAHFAPSSVTFTRRVRQ